MDKFVFRAAKVTEAQVLSDLAIRSKSHWPYDKEYLDLCKRATHIKAEDLMKWPFIVASKGEKILGFAAVLEIDGENMLDHLWIEPEWIGQGLGTLLFKTAVAKARKLGWKKFLIQSDPYAEEFYLKLGAKRVGTKESKIKKGFFLPLLRYDFP